MFNMSSVQALANKSNKICFRFLTLALIPVTSVAFLSSCAHIEVQPKDPQLKTMEDFVRIVSVHILEVDPSTYAEYQNMLTTEVAPGVLSQMKKRHLAAQSAAEVKSRVDQLTKSNESTKVQIETAEFPSRATETNLVPIEVKGEVVKTSGDTKGQPSKFDIIYLVGINKSTQLPIIASLQMK
jgi:hypothetical protein